MSLRTNCAYRYRTHPCAIPSRSEHPWSRRFAIKLQHQALERLNKRLQDGQFFRIDTVANLGAIHLTLDKS